MSADTRRRRRLDVGRMLVRNCPPAWLSKNRPIALFPPTLAPWPGTPPPPVSANIGIRVEF